MGNKQRQTKIRNQILAIGLILIMVPFMSACGRRGLRPGGQSSGRSIFTYYDQETQEFAKNFNEDEIISAFYQKNYETAEEYMIQEDKEQIRQLFDALSEITVVGETDEMASGYDDVFIFTLPTAQAFTFQFNMHHLVIGDTCYEVEGAEDLWKLAAELAGDTTTKNNGKENGKDAVQTADDDIRIVPTKAKLTTLEPYQTDAFSMQIPSGWTVETGADGMFHSIHVYDPEEPVNQVFLLLKAMPLMHSETSRDYYRQSYEAYGGTYYIMADAPVLAEPSTENFYRIFSDYAAFVEKDEPEYSGYTFPRFNEFTTLESFESTSPMKDAALNPAILHATFTDADGNRGEGMFTADVVDLTGSLASGFGIDAGYYTAYDIMVITAAENELIEWQDILYQCINSIQYSDAFVSNTNAQSDAQLANAMQLRSTLNEISDGIMASWEARNTSDEIMRQKQSDAILDYDRVYDTETNEVYRTPLGWLDGYDGDRFKNVTDDAMYTLPIEGTIME